MDDTMMNDIVKTDVRQQILHGMSGVGKRFFKKGNFEKKPRMHGKCALRVRDREKYCS